MVLVIFSTIRNLTSHLLKETPNKRFILIRNSVLELALVGFTIDIDQIRSSSCTSIRSLEVIDESVEVSLVGHCVAVDEKLNLLMDIVFDELIDDLKI
ncbi:hypothetical protein A4G99_15860 [Haladaptatus sp. R4]|nr:hypothetical protein A4G99_15860 [Haladaptatus sp. R4]